MLVPRPAPRAAPRRLDPVHAAPLPTPRSRRTTPYAARGRKLGPGSTAVVIGVGGLGHLAVQILKATTAARIIAVDPRDTARDLGKRSGADLVLAPGDDVAAEIREASRGLGADVVLDFVGSDETLRSRPPACGSSATSPSSASAAAPCRCRSSGCPTRRACRRPTGATGPSSSRSSTSGPAGCCTPRSPGSAGRGRPRLRAAADRRRRRAGRGGAERPLPRLTTADLALIPCVDHGIRGHVGAHSRPRLPRWARPINSVVAKTRHGARIWVRVGRAPQVTRDACGAPSFPGRPGSGCAGAHTSPAAGLPGRSRWSGRPASSGSPGASGAQVTCGGSLGSGVGDGDADGDADGDGDGDGEGDGDADADAVGDGRRRRRRRRDGRRSGDRRTPSRTAASSSSGAGAGPPGPANPVAARPHRVMTGLRRPGPGSDLDLHRAPSAAAQCLRRPRPRRGPVGRRSRPDRA